MHILVSAPPHMARARSCRIKGRSSSKLFEEFPCEEALLGRHFGPAGFLCHGGQ